MRNADRIRLYGQEKYVLPARSQKIKTFSIRAGDVLRELKMIGRTPAICSALSGREFLRQNHLRLVARSGPKSGQSTTVVYTYEFLDMEQGAESSTSQRAEPWARLRGALKEVFAELGGGERYLRAERDGFQAAIPSPPEPGGRESNTRSNK